MMAIRTLLAAALVLPLLGCATPNVSGSASDRAMLDAARGPEENRRLHTDLIREMIQQDRLYAGLAHLEAQQKEFGDSRELRLLRAEILRKLGRNDEAEDLYRDLLDTRHAGLAEHGLGLIYAPRSLGLGVRHLRRAVKLRPTDARIRNDLGYALMRQGKLDEARLHLATAFQLEDGADLSRNNYILVLLLDGDEAEARRVAANAQVTASLMTRLRERAQNIKSGSADLPFRPDVGGGGG